METRKEFEQKLPQRIEVVKKRVKEGYLIGYRPNLVLVQKVLEEGVQIKGPYGETQVIDWEDVVEYNRDLWS